MNAIAYLKWIFSDVRPVFYVNSFMYVFIFCVRQTN